MTQTTRARKSLNSFYQGRNGAITADDKAVGFMMADNIDAISEQIDRLVKTLIAVGLAVFAAWASLTITLIAGII